MTKPAIRVANFSGYSSDRFEAVTEVTAGDPVDVLVGDYLAEFTLAGMARQITPVAAWDTWSGSGSNCGRIWPGSRDGD